MNGTVIKFQRDKKRQRTILTIDGKQQEVGFIRDLDKHCQILGDGEIYVGAYEISDDQLIIYKNLEKCSFCKYHDDFTWTCSNGDSDERGDFTDDEMSCSHWEKRECK